MARGVLVSGCAGMREHRPVRLDHLNCKLNRTNCKLIDTLGSPDLLAPEQIFVLGVLGKNRIAWVPCNRLSVLLYVFSTCPSSASCPRLLKCLTHLVRLVRLSACHAGSRAAVLPPETSCRFGLMLFRFLMQVAVAVSFHPARAAVQQRFSESPARNATDCILRRIARRSKKHNCRRVRAVTGSSSRPVQAAARRTSLGYLGQDQTWIGKQLQVKLGEWLPLFQGKGVIDFHARKGVLARVARKRKEHDGNLDADSKHIRSQLGEPIRRRTDGPGDAGVCEQNNPFAQALALQSSGRNCSPASDSMLRKRMFQGSEFSGGISF